jgi:hypothetical protein
VAPASPAAPDTVLASVGRRVVGPAEFRRQWSRAAAQVVPRGASREAQKAAFLDALVDRELLTQAALDGGFHPTAEQEVLLGALRLIAMRVAYYRRLVSPGPQGSDPGAEAERARYEALVARLLAPLSPAYVDSNLAFLVAAYAGVPPPISQGPEGPRIDFRLHLPDVAPSDTGRVLATTRQGDFTVQRFLWHWGQLNAIDRVPPDSPEHARLWAERFLAQGPMDEEARARGFDRLPEVEREVERRRDAMAGEWYFRREVVARVDTSEAVLRARWEAGPERYYGTTQYAYRHLWYGTREAAWNALRLLRDGADWEAVIARRFPPGTPHEEVAAYRAPQELPESSPDTTLVRWFASGARGDLFGPREIEGRWWIYRLLARREGRRSTYEEARGFVRDDLVIEESERLLRARLAELKERYAVRVHRERLAALEVEDPFLDQKGPPAPARTGPLMPSLWEDASPTP